MIVESCSERQSVGIVVPPVWTQVFMSLAQLLKYALDDLGFCAEIVEYEGNLHQDWHIILGWSLYEKPFPEGCRYVLYQLEPLRLPFWQERIKAKEFLFEAAEAIWDYSELNLPILQGLSVHLVALGYHPKLQEVKLKTRFQEFDVLFVGFMSPRRHFLLERLANRCSLSMQPRWGSDFRETLANTKILINIHQYDDPTPLEQPRVAYALNQGSFVLTETPADAPYPWLPSAPYDQLVERALYYLYHPLELRDVQRESFSQFSSVLMAQNICRAVQLMG